MNKELTEKFYRDFPLLYRFRGRDNVNTKDRDSQSLMYYGFPCDSWADILYEASKKLEIILETLPPEKRPYACQVKNKFNSLRFYMHPHNLVTEEMHEIIKKAAQDIKNLEGNIF